MQKQSLSALMIVTGLALSVALTGCSKSPEPATEAKTQQTPAPAPRVKVIDDITGRTAVESGKKAKATLQAVQQQRDEDFKQLVE